MTAQERTVTVAGTAHAQAMCGFTRAVAYARTRQRQPGGSCRACGQPIRWVKRLGGWVHYDNSVWCASDQPGIVIGSCAQGPEL